VVTVIAQQHPHWCGRTGVCTANGAAGAHRSASVVVDPAVRIRANLYAVAAAPDVVLVEFSCGETVLAPRVAYGLGRVLVSLGRAGGAP
jgi:hypothetical protein